MMTKNKKYSYFDFAKAAFKWRFKLPLLGDFPYLQDLQFLVLGIPGSGCLGWRLKLHT
jgi:hypothetical protein